MKMLDGETKNMILQSFSLWAKSVNDDISKISQDIDKGADIPPVLLSMIKENANKIENVMEILDTLFEMNVVCLDDREFDSICESLG